MKKYKKGIFIGRFQPFHKGHLKVVKKAQSECEKLVIGIGSADSYNEVKNPLNSNERKEIISKVLEEEEISATIIEIKDVPDDVEWMNSLIAYDFDVIYSSNRWVLDTADSVKWSSGMDYRIIDVKPQVDSNYTRDISATKIRLLIAGHNDAWKSMVPRSARAIIEEKYLQKFCDCCSQKTF